MYERVKQNSQKPTEKQMYNQSQNIRLALKFSCGISTMGKVLLLFFGTFLLVLTKVSF